MCERERGGRGGRQLLIPRCEKGRGGANREGVAARESGQLDADHHPDGKDP